MSYKSLLLIAGLLVAAAVPGRAQDLVLGQTFGSGVHAYFAQDYVRAYNFFCAAIESGSQDPRCFYFRGLCYLRLDRPEAAKADFQKGADLETGDTGRSYPVARLLERVQGSDRYALEQYRASARLIITQREEAQRRARYEQNREVQSQVLQSAAPAAPAATRANPADGFQTGPIAAPAAPAESTPAAEPAAPIAIPMPAADEAEAKPAAKKAKASAGKSADEDPFGTGAATEKPAAKAAAKADEDPFGMAAPAAEKPAAKKAAKDSADDDPFGAAAEKKPVAKKTGKTAPKPADDNK